MLSPDRLIGLLALEIRRLVEDIDRRTELLVEIWARYRSRKPFLDTTFARWTTLGFPELGQLDEEQVEALEIFYRELDELRLYVAYTEDMPKAMEDALRGSVARLKSKGSAALIVLGKEPIEEVQPLGWEIRKPGEAVEWELSLGEE